MRPDRTLTHPPPKAGQGCLEICHRLREAFRVGVPACHQSLRCQSLVSMDSLRDRYRTNPCVHLSSSSSSSGEPSPLGDPSRELMVLGSVAAHMRWLTSRNVFRQAFLPASFALEPCSHTRLATRANFPPKSDGSVTYRYRATYPACAR